MKRSVRLGRRIVPIWLIVAVIVVAVSAITWHEIGTIKINYTITPPQTQNPAINPTSISLDLGTIPYGSSGSKDFGKRGTLILPANCTVDCILNNSWGFKTFEVWIKLYRFGAYPPTHTFYMKWEDSWGKAVSDQHEVEAGDYDIYLEVNYKANVVDALISGAAQIDIQYATP